MVGKNIIILYSCICFSMTQSVGFSETPATNHITESKEFKKLIKYLVYQSVIAIALDVPQPLAGPARNIPLPFTPGTNNLYPNNTVSHSQRGSGPAVFASPMFR
jgi:hypothetical protein